MTRPELMARLQTVFDNVFIDKVVLTPVLTAHDVPEWDSLMQVSLIVAIEGAFSIRFRVGEVEATKCVGDLADLIAKRVAT